MSERVLVVDDEENIVFLVESALQLQGYTTVAACDGRSALALIDEFRPDLVVLDVMLPDIDGFTVLRRMRDSGSQIPVIFLSARDGTDDRVHGLTVGGDDYMVKPFAVAELVARVRLSLRRRGGVDDRTLSCADTPQRGHAGDFQHTGSRGPVLSCRSHPPSTRCCAIYW